MQSQIIIVVLNIIQFQSISPIIATLIKANIKFDIVVPDYRSSIGFDEGVAQLFDDTYIHLCKLSYNPIRIINPEVIYKIELSPYPVDWVIKINSAYKIKYRYGMVTKPNVAFDIETNVYYDVVLCYGPYDASFIDAFTKTLIVGDIKYALNKNIRKHKTNIIKTILYLPTYGKDSSINILVNKLIDLKNVFNIITKAHHLTSYSSLEKDNLKKLYKIGEVFDQKKSIMELLNKADVVLSDNSGAIWDAIISNIPVAIFTGKNQINYEGITVLHQKLVNENIIPGTDKIEYLESTIQKALKKEYFIKQQIIKKKLFPITGNKSLRILLGLINDILNDKFPQNYKKAHDQLKRYIERNKNLKQTTLELQQKHDVLKN